MGRILCGSFYRIVDGHTTKPYTFRLDDKRYTGRSRIDDNKLAVAIRDELERYNLLVSWNGKLFDAPFLNARLAKAGERPLRPQMHLDCMYYAGGCSMRIGSKKLVNVQKFFNLSDAKTEISWDKWNLASGGDKASLDDVVHHCEQDVKVLAQAYWKLLPAVANLHR
jgi:uncharacterized protein YprB with RNaseH-like and TPR domain